VAWFLEAQISFRPQRFFEKREMPFLSKAGEDGLRLPHGAADIPE
jgi:hypothetical protein